MPKIRHFYGVTIPFHLTSKTPAVSRYDLLNPCVSVHPIRNALSCMCQQILGKTFIAVSLFIKEQQVTPAVRYTPHRTAFYPCLPSAQRCSQVLQRTAAWTVIGNASLVDASAWHWIWIPRCQTSFSRASPLEHPFIKLTNSDTMESMEDLLSYL